MELELALFGQVVIGLILCLPALIAATAPIPLDGTAARAPRARALMGRSKYAFYAR